MLKLVGSLVLVAFAAAVNGVPVVFSTIDIGLDVGLSATRATILTSMQTQAKLDAVVGELDGTDVALSVYHSELVGFNDDLTSDPVEDVVLAITKARCGLSLWSSGNCVGTLVPAGAGQASNGTVHVLVTSSLNESEYATQVSDGLTFLDGGFLTNMATFLASMTAANITLTELDGSSFLFSVAVSHEEVATAPSGEAFMQSVRDLTAVLTASFDALIVTHGAVGDVITLTNIDLCAGRTCNGEGSCSAESGLCACETGNGFFWGADCGVPCVCSNGGTCLQSSCACVYPYWGLTCAAVKSECSDGSCV